ncbi:MULTISPECIES: phosphotransferase family protein [Rhodopseudomonas]|uniref:phosphotransferase family protein n=1 Tax=Rhodopseudomonas TaxID=1073 RepID=UPI00128E2C95|nr:MULTISPECIES: phosphotransferase family protein [Rhodopseudomonas]MDF3809373.1 phosphotransferase family protein [Rhodopseudomonas sp. BAL398]WOK16955.1 phosphotransferase family protein [Rhodopseudomonas sp. BAL398]
MNHIQPASATRGPELLSEADTAPANWDRVAQYLRTQGMTFDSAQPVRQFAGGLANRNYLVVVDGQNAVLRRPPDGELPPGAHDMAREHKILSRLADALTFVPRSLHYCDRRNVIGVPFQLIEYRPGIVIRGDDLSPVEGRPDAAPVLCQMLVSTLASLHAVDARSVGLDDLGKPQGFIGRAIAGWSKRGALVAESPSTQSLLKEISNWLSEQRFRERPAAVLHCDFKLDNLILDPVSLAPLALVDWDMGTRGDPLFDLATLLSYWAEPGDPPAMQKLRQMPTAHPGFWRRSEVAEYYAALTGQDLDDLAAMRVLALFKLGVVFLQLHRQWTNGAVKDNRYAEFGRLGEDLLLIARDVGHGVSNDRSRS